METIREQLPLLGTKKNLPVLHMDGCAEIKYKGELTTPNRLRKCINKQYKKACISKDSLLIQFPAWNSCTELITDCPSFDCYVFIDITTFADTAVPPSVAPIIYANFVEVFVSRKGVIVIKSVKSEDDCEAGTGAVLGRRSVRDPRTGVLYTASPSSLHNVIGTEGIYDEYNWGTAQENCLYDLERFAEDVISVSCQYTFFLGTKCTKVPGKHAKCGSKHGKCGAKHGKCDCNHKKCGCNQH